MKFKKGDRVSVLDEDLSGYVMQVQGDVVTVETEDGFLLDFQLGELVLESSNDIIGAKVFSKSNVKQVVTEKEVVRKKRPLKKKTKDKKQPPMEVDLHIHHLVKSSKGLSNYDMLNLQLDTAKRQIEFAIGKRIQRIVFIHGVGEGVLKLELQHMLKRYDNLKYYDADYQKYGLGATEVYIFQN